MRNFVKSFFAALLCAALGLFIAQGAASAAPGGPMKVGMTVQDLSNQIWAGACDALEKLVEDDGGDFTYLD